MHFDIGVIIKGIIEIGINLLRLFGVVKPMLDTTKTGLEIFEGSKKLLEKAPEPERPEQVTERVRAMAAVTWSLAPLAFAEVLFWTLRSALLLGVIRAYLEFLRIQRGK